MVYIERVNKPVILEGVLDREYCHISKTEEEEANFQEAPQAYRKFVGSRYFEKKKKKFKLKFTKGRIFFRLFYSLYVLHLLENNFGNVAQFPI